MHLESDTAEEWLRVSHSSAATKNLLFGKVAPPYPSLAGPIAKKRHSLLFIAMLENGNPLSDMQS